MSQQTAEQTSVAPRRVTWTARVLAGFVFALGITTLASTAPADAFVGPAVPIVIGETLAAPAADTLAAGTCAGLLPLCLGIGAAVGAGALYATRDSWLPVVKGVFSSAFSSDTGTGGCFSLSMAPDAAGTGVTWTYAFSGCGGNGLAEYLSWKCRSASGLVTSGGPTYKNLLGLQSGSGSGSVESPDLCPSGGAIVWAQATPASSGNSHTLSFGTAVPDSDVSQTTTVTCALADGSTETLTKNVTGQTDGVIIPSCQAAYPGSVPTHVGVTGGWPGSEQNLWSQDLVNPAEQYPDCFATDGTYLNTCRVRVWIDGQPCVNGMAGCYDPEQYVQDHPDATKECKWGPYSLPWHDCDALKHHYGTDAATQTQTVTNTDPATGMPDTDPTSDTNTGKTTDQGMPTTGDNPSSVPGVDGSTEPDSQNCWGSGWSWNPVSWVYIPTKCALMWAFVPDPGYWDAQVGTIRQTFEDSTPGQYASAVATVLPQYPDGGGCAGIPVHYDLGLRDKQEPVDFHLGAACEGDTLHTAAGIVKLVISALVIVGGIFTCARLVFHGFAYDLDGYGQTGDLVGHEVNK